jgi:hypothetical protein
MKSTGIVVDLVDDPRLHREDFRLVSVQTGEDLMRRIASAGVDNGSSGRPERPDDSEARRRTSRAPRPMSGRPSRPVREESEVGRRAPVTDSDVRSSGGGGVRAPRPHRPFPAGVAAAPGQGNGRREPTGRRRRGSRGRGRRSGRPILEDNPSLSGSVVPPVTAPVENPGAES